jgi:hypothetical protein
MIVKPAIKWLLQASDAEVLVIVRALLAGIAANAAIFTTPTPDIVSIQAALDAFVSALEDAALGGPAQTAIKNAKRAILAGLVRLLANYVGAVADGDMSILLLSGFPHQKPSRTKVGPLPKPGVPKVVQGTHSGTLASGTAPVYGAGAYNWRLALASAPTVYVQTAQTMGGRVVFAGLTAGQTYNVEVSAAGAEGPSDWSDPGTAMII